MFSVLCLRRIGRLGFILKKVHFLAHLLEDLERSGSISPAGAGPFEQFNVLLRQLYRMTSRRLPMEMRRTVQNRESGLCRVQGTEDGVERSGCAAAGPKSGSKRKKEEFVWCKMESDCR